MIINQIGRSELFKKLLRAYQGHNLISKIYRNTIALYHINNINTYVLNEECKTYTKYKRKYKALLNNGVDIDLRQSKSDIVWICWLQGMENAPALVRACYNSVRKNIPNANIVIITEKNLAQYVHFPSYIMNKYKSGHISSTHLSDLIRISLLDEYGGTWIDATVLITGRALVEYAKSQRLFAFKQINLMNGSGFPIVASSWFITAYSHHPIIALTRKLLYEYWKTNLKLENYYLFHIFFTLSTERYPEEWNSVPMYNNCTPHELLYQLSDKYNEEGWTHIINASDIHKLSRHNTDETEMHTYYKYIINNYCIDLV